MEGEETRRHSLVKTHTGHFPILGKATLTLKALMEERKKLPEKNKERKITENPDYLKEKKTLLEGTTSRLAHCSCQH